MNLLTSALCFYVVLSLTTLGAFGGGDMGDDHEAAKAHGFATGAGKV